jgi:hypothetical protein
VWREKDIPEHGYLLSFLTKIKRPRIEWQLKALLFGCLPQFAKYN